MANAKSSIKGELAKIVCKKVEPSYLESLGILSGITKSPSILQAIALAQVKKGLEGELKAAEFIEKLLCSNSEEKEEGADSFDVVVKVLDGNDGA
ncbi:MAG: hypothetical protein IJ299_02730 [Oscillospiraceae bacterium]|nr:hypothetical protein [Oscillospiraceae bacterium]